MYGWMKEWVDRCIYVMVRCVTLRYVTLRTYVCMYVCMSVYIAREGGREKERERDRSIEGRGERESEEG